MWTVPFASKIFAPRPTSNKMQPSVNTTLRCRLQTRPFTSPFCHSSKDIRQTPTMNQAEANVQGVAPPQGNAPSPGSASPVGRGLLQSGAQAQEVPDGYTYYLPHYAVGVDTVEMTTPEGLEAKHVRLLNTPNQDYLARRINSGEEFAIGGTKRHVVQSLALELARRPEERWHIIAVKDDTLSNTGAPRCAYSMYPTFLDTNNRGAYDSSLDVPGQEGIPRQEVILPAAEELLVPGTDYFPPRGADGTYKDGGSEYKDRLRRRCVVLNGARAQQMINLTAGNLPFIGSGQQLPNLNFDFNPGSLVFNDGAGDPQQSLARNGEDVQMRGGQMQGGQMQVGQMLDSQMQFHPMDPFVSPRDVKDRSQQRAEQRPQQRAEQEFRKPPFQLGEELSPEQEQQAQQWLQEFREWKKNKRAKIKKERELDDEAIIEADGTWDNYTGTNLCRWCGRRGHEAVECIKWDPDHLDKLVCVKCNNKKHVIDECPDFKNLPIERQEKLLLQDGACRPGVRSLYWDWVCIPCMPCIDFAIPTAKTDIFVCANHFASFSS